MTTPTIHIDVPMDDIRAFCERWGIVKFAFFGSVLRDDFGPESDLDVLAWFNPDSQHTLLDHIRMEQELTDLFEKKVEIVNRKALDEDHNRERALAILEGAHVIWQTG